jgi:tetratricopeptide (TPR) repeat protein
MNLPSGESNACYNIASTFLHLRQIDSAYWYINRAMAIATGTDMPIPPEYYITLGNVYRAQGKYQRAVENSLKAYSLGKQKNLPLIVSDATLLLSEIYGKTGHEDLAYAA